MGRALPNAERDAWLRLKLTPGVGDASARKLLAAFANFQTSTSLSSWSTPPTLAPRLRLSR